MYPCTISFIPGTGGAVVYVSSPPVVCEHFKGRSQSMALTFNVAGSGVGGMLYAYLTGFLMYVFLRRLSAVYVVFPA